MITKVHLDSNFRKQLKRLHRAGGNARRAAEHAETIIRQCTSGTVKSPKEVSRLTRFGECRIKNCLKYDLVDAYRLLVMKDNDHLFFLFIGSHDECDQWIAHNSGISQGIEKRRNAILAVDPTSCDPGEAELLLDEFSDDSPFTEIDERDLRIIFAGLCRSRTNRCGGEITTANN